VDVVRHKLTMPQVLQHLEQLEQIEATAAARRGGAAKPVSGSREQHRVSWVEFSTNQAASLLEGIMSDSESSSEDDLLAAVAALPPDMLSEPQRAAVILQAWENAAHTKPANFDAGAQLMVPGLADVAVVSRGGWQRHSFKSCNQDSFLALPLAVAPPSGQACGECPAAADCGAAALAIGVFDGHGRTGAAASAHLRNALASGLLMHNQLAQAARRACAATGPAPCGSGEAPGSAAAAPVDPADEAAQLLERCFAAAASTMPSTGTDFSLSGSTAVMCLVQPGSVTAAWAGDSRAVLGLCKGERYIACALTSDHKPSSPLERARIEAAGGWVMQTMIDEAGKPAGPHRVYLRETNVPGLAVSRCFGDYVAAAAGVTSTPDVVTMVLPTGSRQGAEHGRSSSGQHGRGRQGAARGRHPQQHAASAPQAQQCQGRSRSRRGGSRGRHGEQARGPQQGRRPQHAQRGAPPPLPAAHATIGSDKHVLIVASDGLWEFVSNAEAVRIAARCANAQLAAEALVLEAQAQWAVKFGGAHCDDITVAVAFLPCDGSA
jgi:RNA polymerase II C-terminal domain phosphatase-like 3/4